MMRRCMESGHARFGMSLHPGARHGTMLNIHRFEQLPDGRSLIETTGSTRFTITGQAERDGYTVATVEWFEEEVREPKERILFILRQRRDAFSFFLLTPTLTMLRPSFALGCCRRTARCCRVPPACAHARFCVAEPRHSWP